MSPTVLPGRDILIGAEKAISLLEIAAEDVRQDTVNILK
jgi:hypothetical protein